MGYPTAEVQRRFDAVAQILNSTAPANLRYLQVAKVPSVGCGLPLVWSKNRCGQVLVGESFGCSSDKLPFCGPCERLPSLLWRGCGLNEVVSFTL